MLIVLGHHNCRNPHTIGSKWNSSFTTIAQNLVFKIKATTSFYHCLDTQVQHSIFLNPTGRKWETLIFSEIYGISGTFLKLLRSSILEMLSIMLNESFSQGIFPDHMELDMVTSMYNRSSIMDVTNYRPIFILSIFCKT